MNKYKYFLNPPHTLIFECTAKSIIEADKLYQGALGKDPAKQTLVSCAIVFGEGN